MTRIQPQARGRLSILENIVSFLDGVFGGTQQRSSPVEVDTWEPAAYGLLQGVDTKIRD
jgi:hypothetical protein